MKDFANQEKHCPVCGKEFIARAEWAYKEKGKFYCTWGCLQAERKGHGTPAERRERIIQAIHDGLTNAEIQKLLGEDSRKVDYWRKKLDGGLNNDRQGKDDK